MTNSIANVSDGLTFIGRSLLRSLKSKNILLRKVNTQYLQGWSYGSSFSIPSLDISGGAAVRAVGGAATADDIVSLTQTLTKQQIYKAVKIENLQQLWSSVNMMAKVGERLAYKIGKKADGIVAGLWTQFAYEVGTLDGTAAFDPTLTSDVFKPLNDARRIMMQNDADTDGWSAVLNPYESSRLRAIPGLVKVNEAGSSDLLRQAMIGNIFGFDVLESQQIQNGTVSAAAQTASPGAVSNASGYPSNTTTMHVSGLGTGSVKAGTIFTISGVNNDEGFAVGFAVQADATITSNAADITFLPPLPVAVVDTTAITFAEHSAAGSMNLAFHKDAIAVAIQGMAPFMEGTGVAVQEVTDDVTGLSIQLAMKSNLLGAAGTAFTTEIAASVIFGAGVVMPQLGVRIVGHV